MGQDTWKDERLVERLKQLWADKLSGSEIACELGRGLTRNAVIGKVHRLGLEKRQMYTPPRNRPNKARPKKKDAVFPFRAVISYCEPDIVDDSNIPIGQRRRLVELNAYTCRWPVGDPSKPDLFFCGSAVVEDHPYCPAHCARAYTQADRRQTLKVAA